MNLTDEQIENIIEQARFALRAHSRSIRGQTCHPADYLEYHVVLATLNACKKHYEQILAMQPRELNDIERAKDTDHVSLAAAREEIGRHNEIERLRLGGWS